MNEQKKGKLFLIPTLLAPGTESSVIAPKINALIRELQYYIVENVKTSRRFISALKLNVPIHELIFFELNKRTDESDIPEMLAPLREGHNVGLLSEAGVPCIADPGKLVVRKAHQQNIQVIPLPGPSSILLALMASGFNGQQFTFHGYLPIDKNQRHKTLKRLEQVLHTTGYTQIFMETPYRNDKLISELVNTLAPDTKLCLAINLTGEYENIETRTIKDWKKNQPHPGKVPAIFLLGV